MVYGIKGLGEVQKNTKCMKVVIYSGCNVINEV